MVRVANEIQQLKRQLAEQKVEMADHKADIQQLNARVEWLEAKLEATPLHGTMNHSPNMLSKVALTF